MIFHAPATGVSVPPAVVVCAEAQAVSGQMCQGSAHDGPTALTGSSEEEGDSLWQRWIRERHEEFDWMTTKTRREFIRLEQKVLANRANPEEANRYEAMKSDRNSKIFADRQFRDYAEVQRLRKLSQKLAEVQQYLRPIAV